MGDAVFRKKYRFGDESMVIIKMTLFMLLNLVHVKPATLWGQFLLIYPILFLTFILTIFDPIR